MKSLHKFKKEAKEVIIIGCLVGLLSKSGNAEARELGEELASNIPTDPIELAETLDRATELLGNDIQSKHKQYMDRRSNEMYEASGLRP